MPQGASTGSPKEPAELSSSRCLGAKLDAEGAVVMKGAVSTEGSGGDGLKRRFPGKRGRPQERVCGLPTECAFESLVILCRALSSRGAAAGARPRRRRAVRAGELLQVRCIRVAGI